MPLITELQLFHDGGLYHIEISPLIGFYIIGTYVMKELINQYFNSRCLGYPFSFSFQVGSFFPPQNTLNPSHGLDYLRQSSFV